MRWDWWWLFAQRHLPKSPLHEQSPGTSHLVHQYIAFVLRRLGRWEEAEPYYRKAIELDPLNVQLLSSFGSEGLRLSPAVQRRLRHPRPRHSSCA